MDYDFSCICNDQMEILNKKFESLKKAFVKDYIVAINVINNPHANENIESLKIALNELIDDEIGKSSISWTGTLNKVQKLLTSNLKD